ncbi:MULTISPECIES: hypothetical protein [unclassified Modestobacter]|uniref:hypothetical protein n=1 Tax=unclassified Modestobacter TaxID=2643866 RepID=UPI0022AB1E84|nr:MULTISPECIES: hypothetical protein [unclassified Modestobacter]MCZ2826363.1 hypothetical protein [Modestobacter sp. VKM Ac-2981]MCZ2852572.1 hypothetical protein [Modestobacter sp. VKM Ac-2982]
MDLRSLAARRTAVLAVEVPGWGRTRCALEQHVRTRGWRLADSPADADLLVVCGRPGARLTAAVEHVWGQLPGPRARAEVTTAEAVPAALDRATAELADGAAQRRDADGRPAEPDPGTTATATGDDGDGDGDMDMDMDMDMDDDSGDMDHGDMDHGDMDHGDMDHGDMDHGDMDMDMPMPGGIGLAGGGGDDQLADPDSLDLDVLHVPLGPVLPHWPAGLLLHTTLQGDLVVAARAEVLLPADGSPTDPPVHGTAAGRWDAVATLLALAGWDDAAVRAARVRDELLAGGQPPEADRLARRITRSRLLRWSLRGLGRLPEGDAHDRLRHWLAGTEQRRSTELSAVADLVTGLDLASARLVVASLDLDTADRVTVPVEAGS